jgi:beta-glucosidase-like glycosyl hydrolase/CubicO group peptidase (beta-lactamase class C family)
LSASSPLAASVRPTLLQQADAARMEQWVDSVFNTLSAEERLGQLIVPIVDAKGMTPAQRQVLLRDVEQYHVGGLLFSGCSMKEQAAFTNLAAKRARVPLLVTLDGEWGLNMRMKEAPRYPRNMALGCISTEVKTADGSTLRDSLMTAYGTEVARQCRAMGISVNFAPVMDINSNVKNPVIGTRSFGDTPKGVYAPAIAYAKALEAGGVLSVAKHFPGHGDTDKDSHKTLPTLLHKEHRLRHFEMVPFAEYINSGLGGVMVGHLAVPALESDTRKPASISARIVLGELRDRYGFDGLVFTDGLAMEGARRIEDVGVKALLAGDDILLDPVPLEQRRQELLKAVASGKLPQRVVDEKCRRVLRYKFALGLAGERREAQPDSVDTPHARQLARELYAASLCLLKNEHSHGAAIVPLQHLDAHSLVCVNIGETAVNSFSRRVAQYASVQRLSATDGMSAQQQSALLGKVASAGRCIVAIYDAKPSSLAWAKKVCDAVAGEYILCFFTTPYRTALYADLFHRASALLLAHDDCVTSNEVAAEALFGGVAVSGRLSVELPGVYARGTGHTTHRLRLSAAEPEATGMSSVVMQRIDTIVAEGLAQQAFPGCQVLVAKDGYIIYNKAFGYSDYEHRQPVTTESIYDLASMSKAVATVPAVMMAYDEANLRLTDRISAYVPQMKNTDKKTLTLREALFHETGMRESYPVYTWAIDSTSVQRLYSNKRGDPYTLQQDENLWFNRNYRYDTAWVSTRQDATHTLAVAEGMYLNPAFRDTVFNRILALPLVKRGAYRYSCLNFVLLRRVVEQVSHRSLDDYLHSKLFAPLGASTLCYNPLTTLGASACADIMPTEDDAAVRRQLLRGYVHDEIAAFNGGVEGNAGLFGSAQDVVKVLQMLLNCGTYAGQRYVKRETCRLFTSTKSPNSRRGLGFDKPNTSRPSQSPTAPECPATVYGHTGFTGTCFWVDPDNRMIYIFLSNRVYPHRWNKELSRGNYRTRIQSVLYQAMER